MRLGYVQTLTGTDVDWAEEDTELPSGNQHLWEESWDDDDTTEDFSAQLKYVSLLLISL